MICEQCAAEIAKPRRRPRVDERGRRLARVSHVLVRGRPAPMLRLTGAWLAKLGFGWGQEVEIEVRRRKLVIRAVAAGDTS